MARIKIRKKNGEPEWLVQRRITKQRKYDRKKANANSQSA